MFKVKVLKADDIKKILSIKDVIKAVEEAYVAKAQKKAQVFSTIFHEFKAGKADMDIKAGHLLDANIYGLKQVSWFNGNLEKGLPPLIGLIMIFESDTGRPIGLLDASHITSLRTGAAGGIGIKNLARKDSKTILIVGSGNQAKYQIATSLFLLNKIEKVYVYNPLFPNEATKFVDTIKDFLINDFMPKPCKDEADYDDFEKVRNIKFEVVKNIEEAAKKSDIIITATPSKNPMIKKDWISPGTHINCIGSDMEGKQEIDENIFGIARVFVDDINQAITVGETEMAIKNGIITKENIIGEIGEILEGSKKGRLTDDDITLFDTSGLAIQDLITAKYALDMAEKKGFAIEVEV